MKNLFVILLVLLVGCEYKSSQESCKSVEFGHIELIGYRVAKHSHMYVKLIETGKEYDLGSLGGRREPSVEIGDQIPVHYCKETGELYFDRHLFVRRPENTKTRVVGRKPKLN